VGTRTRSKIRPRILVGHPDAAWVDQAKARLQAMGYLVTECLELAWVPDLLGGSLPFDLAIVSSELEPDGQARIVQALKDRGAMTKLILLLDELDASTVSGGAPRDYVVHRVTEGVHQLAILVAAQIGLPPRTPEV
jgi:hypothetical protein